MTEAILNWFADTMARTDVIDLYFIVSDLVDLTITDAERCQTAHYDAMAMSSLGEGHASNVPLGKLVL